MRTIYIIAMSYMILGQFFASFFFGVAGVVFGALTTCVVAYMLPLLTRKQRWFMLSCQSIQNVMFMVESKDVIPLSGLGLDWLTVGYITFVLFPLTLCFGFTSFPCLWQTQLVGVTVWFLICLSLIKATYAFYGWLLKRNHFNKRVGKMLAVKP